MDSPILSVPQTQKHSRVMEIRPKQARAWLTALPIANSLHTARQIYQALFALNRSELTTQNRLELMELYCGPVASVTTALQVHFSRVALPLTAKKRQLADFLRQLHMEMAYGYKRVVQEYWATRYSRLRKEEADMAIERALRYLGEILLHSYHVYMPYPAGVWKEIHALYAYAEVNARQNEPVVVEGEGKFTIAKRYQQILLMGLCGPYQLPQNECHQVDRFLQLWADKAIIDRNLDIANPAGHFLLDLSADAPPVAFPRDMPLTPAASLRVLNAVHLAGTVHAFVNRLQRGERLRGGEIGTECIGDTCLSMLRRMVRFWGLTARRRYSRTQRQTGLAVGVGINAIHFFSSGQKPFSVNLPPPPAPADDTAETSDPENLNTLTDQHARLARAQGFFRVDTWRMRDESAGGMLLTRTGHSGPYVRIGDVLGLEAELGKWRLGLARWLKTPDEDTVIMGVEMLAPYAEPVTVRLAESPAHVFSSYSPALLLPALPGLKRPATLLVSGGMYQPERNLYLMQGDQEPRLIRPVRLIERTNSFEHVSFAEVPRVDASAAA